MGWFWAEQTAPAQRTAAPRSCPVKHDPATQAPVRALLVCVAVSTTNNHHQKSCPVRHETVKALSSASSCPVDHSSSEPTTQPQSVLSRLNPLNYMFRDLSNAPAPGQTVRLPTSREESTIPRGDTAGNWEYPSPQQMYHALLRKGYTDTDAGSVESMVAVHNFLNEGAWAEIVDWERRFAGGLARGWRVCCRGEENVEAAVLKEDGVFRKAAEPAPKLLRFQGRPTEMTPKAAMIQMLGRAWPSKFG
jgi:cytochrome c heme-lyase